MKSFIWYISSAGLKRLFLLLSWSLCMWDVSGFLATGSHSSLYHATRRQRRMGSRSCRPSLSSFQNSHLQIKETHYITSGHLTVVDIEIVTTSQKTDWSLTERANRELMTHTCNSYISLIEEKTECLTYKVWWKQGRICIALHKPSTERSLRSGLLIPEGEEQRFRSASVSVGSSPSLRKLGV